MAIWYLMAILTFKCTARKSTSYLYGTRNANLVYK